MQVKNLNQGLLGFIQASPTPFHAVRQMSRMLQDAGFERLMEQDAWSLAPGKYYVLRNDSSLVAFQLAKTPAAQSGIRMLGAHTDSPCLKIKPAPDIQKNNYLQLGVEVYGGALLNPWFDRDLSIAGRVSFSSDSGDSSESGDKTALKASLIDFERAIAIIPSLAIHLDREVNAGRAVNPQKHMPLLIGIQDPEREQNLLALLHRELSRTQEKVGRILDFELFCYDTQAPALLGIDAEFIASARLDNLLSCYVGLQSLLAAAQSDTNKLLVCNDHEEVGSASAAGARGTFLRSVLERIAGDKQDFSRLINRSMMISVDNAHGVHPNFADKHDDNHGPLLNQGPVIKINAEQRYASNSQTAALFRHVCAAQEIPLQSFVMRSDMACGSTIGPITASEIGVATLDIGVATFAMHSIRELAGSRDPGYLFAALKSFCALDSVALSSCV